MKKVFCMLFSVAFLSSDHVVFAEVQQPSVPEKFAEEIKFEKNDLPEFIDINSIYENEYVQDGVRELQYRMLQLLKTIGKSNPGTKDDVDKIKGNKNDIDQAERRVGYLASLESSLEKSDTLERVKNLLGLNSAGKEEVQKALDLIKAVENADVFEKVRAIPRINKKINEVIDRYETLEKLVETADSIEKIKKIPGIGPKSLAEIQDLEKQVAEIKSLSDVKNIVNNSSISKKLKDQVASLRNLESDLQNAGTFDELKKLPGVNDKIISYIDSQINENKKLKEQLEQLNKEKGELTYHLDTITNDNEKERRFSTRLIGVILRALVGFDYRSAKYNFAKNKSLKLPDKTALVAASKNSFSHLGGTEEALCSITNGLEYVLKILIAEKDWIKKAVPIKKRLEKISDHCKRLNDDADIIKLNVDHAINILSNLLEGAKRPPRDNVKNFDQVREQISDKKK